MHIHLSQCCWDIPSIENNGKFNVYRNVKQIFLYLTLISLLSYRWAGEKICTYPNDLAVVFLGTLSDLVTLLSLSIATGTLFATSSCSHWHWHSSCSMMSLSFNKISTAAEQTCPHTLQTLTHTHTYSYSYCSSIFTTASCKNNDY